MEFSDFSSSTVRANCTEKVIFQELDPIALRSVLQFVAPFSLKRIGQGRTEDRHEQQHHGHEHEKDNEGVAHDVACAELKQP